jgi:RNA polymerase sigma-B factor
MCQASDELLQALGRTPTVGELAEHLAVDEEEVLEALAVASSRRELSLDQPVGDDPGTRLGDLLPDPSPSEDPADLLTLSGLLDALPRLERDVVVMRFFHDLNQDAIAARIGYSQMHVSRLLRRALARMRVQLVEA